MRDAGSFLKNRAERRIKLMLDMLHSQLSGAVDGAAWDRFCAHLWKLTSTHYQLDRVQRAWLTLPQHGEDKSDRYERWTTREDQVCE